MLEEASLETKILLILVRYRTLMELVVVGEKDNSRCQESCSVDDLERRIFNFILC